MTITRPEAAAEPTELIRRAGDLIAERVGQDDPLGQAVEHMLAATAEFVTALPCRDLESAQKALGSARAAVGVASYIVCHIGDHHRTRHHR